MRTCGQLQEMQCKYPRMPIAFSMATICDLWMKKVTMNDCPFFPSSTLAFATPAANRIVAFVGGSSLTLVLAGLPASYHYGKR